MSIRAEKRELIKREILRSVFFYRTQNIPTAMSEKYGVSKQTIYKYIKSLTEEGKITKKSSGDPYELITEDIVLSLQIDGLEEDVVWTEQVKPFLAGTKKNVLDVCQYGFTEILNNAIDHSGAKEVYAVVSKSDIHVTIHISDEGVGIFNKIQQALGLAHPRFSILELAKGKLTTDSSRHSGEGIFFTSKAFDNFFIFSGELLFVSGRSDDMDWLFDERDRKEIGTSVMMIIDKDSDVDLGSVFDAFTSGDELGFTKTHIPVKLLRHEGELLVSRSQAKRLILRFESFKEVVLDFDGIEEVGQAFCDELFRVFQNTHPDVELKSINMNEKVKKMIARTLASM